MSLSVVICTRNRAEQLRTCLTRLALVEPDRRDIELVIIDNGSSDHTADVIEDWLPRLPFQAHAFFEARPGSSQAKNTGIANSTGELIFFTDDDCYLESGFFSKLENAVKQSGFEYGGGQIFPGQSGLDPRVAQLFFQEPMAIPPGTPIIPTGFIQGANFFFRRLVFERAGLFNVHVGAGTPFSCEDIEMCARASRAGFLGGRLPDFIVYHDHGRLYNSKEAEQTVLGYNRGRGAYFAELMQARVDVWPYWWQHSYVDGFGSHEDRLRRMCEEMRGFVDYFEQVLDKRQGD